MSEPLTQAIVRTLTDKLYEKRKAAALEIERQVRDLHKNNHLTELDKLISVLEGLTLSPNGNNRKGGLIGLAAVAIALGKSCPSYASKLITPVLTCFSDLDSRVRYFACESLYNIVKICRSSSLEHFGDLFDVLWKLSSDTDQNVRSGAELLDRLIKEIVIATPTFDLEHLMVLIKERIYTLNSSNRRFIISWLHTVLKVPGFNITSYIPEVVDGIFKALEDQAAAVRETTVSVLGELLYKLDPKENSQVNFGGIINILVSHTTENVTPLAREIALVWLDELSVWFGGRILPSLSAYLVAVLPSLYDPALRANKINENLMELVTQNSAIDMDSVVEVLLNHLQHERHTTRIAVLNWIRHLHKTNPSQMFQFIEQFFPRLLSMLSDSAEDVLMLDILVITDICGHQHQNIDISAFELKKEIKEELRNVSPYLIKFCISLLKMFHEDPKLVAERGIQILRQLCLLLDPRDVYRCLALLLLHFQDSTGTVDYEFLARMVELLNRILLTAAELFQLRARLKNPDVNGCVDLFECLYRCWCHQPICLLSLCLLSQSYQHSAELVLRLPEIDITVDLLAEIDRLVQLIESPILAYVRLDLLSAEHQRSLACVLSAMLMLLPQTDAFNILVKRLQVIPLLTIPDNHKKSSKEKPTKIKYKELLEFFDQTIASRTRVLRENHRNKLDSHARQIGN